MDTYRNGNNGCAQGETLVSYAYGELDEGLRGAFETHLRSCDSCPSELAGISGMRTAVQDWKALEFDPLATPVFEIPEARAVAAAYQYDVPKATWLSAIRNLFTLSPAWSLTAASIAILVLGAGIVLMLSRDGRNSDIAGGNKSNRNDQSLAAATPEKSVQPSPSVVAPVSVPKDVEQTPEVNQPNQKPRVVRTAARPDASPRPRTDVKKPARNERNRVPVSDEIDEDTDDSLRLSELFDEIDAD